MPNFAANLTMLFNEYDFLDRFEQAARSGFKGVEYLFPYEWPVKELQARLQQNNLTQVLFNLPPGNWDQGERGIACLPDRVSEFKRGVELAAEYAQGLGCKQLNCLSGIRPNCVSEAQAWETLSENVRWAAKQLAPYGISVLVEAINSKVDMPGFFMDSTEKVALLMKELSLANVAYQYDIYHMQIMEGDLARNIEQHLPIIKHIQFADNPGRGQPGTGEINYDWLFGFLDKIGYTGWVSAEYRPTAKTVDTLGWFS